MGEGEDAFDGEGQTDLAASPAAEVIELAPGVLTGVGS